jgi:hypothetical protein
MPSRPALVTPSNEQVATVNKTIPKLLPMCYNMVLILSKKDAPYYSEPTGNRAEFLSLA